MNAKPSADSVVANMTQAQRDLLEKWLFDENASYIVTAKRCKTEFGLTLRAEAIQKFYRQTMQKRTVDRILKSVAETNALMKTFTDNPPNAFQVVMAVVGQLAFEATLDPENKQDVRMLKGWTDLLISLSEEGREQSKFAFEREKWELDVARLCFEHHAELQTITADKSLDEDARLFAIRRRLFGSNLPE